MTNTQRQKRTFWIEEVSTDRLSSAIRKTVSFIILRASRKTTTTISAKARLQWSCLTKAFQAPSCWERAAHSTYKTQYEEQEIQAFKNCKRLWRTSKTSPFLEETISTEKITCILWVHWDFLKLQLRLRSNRQLRKYWLKIRFNLQGI